MSIAQLFNHGLTTSVRVEKITSLPPADLADLCEATEDAIRDGIGFNWLTPPSRELLESYWNGVLMIPERVLFGGRLDGVLCASVQLLMPAASKQTTAFAVTIANHFVAPWARGHGLAKALLEAAEAEAQAQGFSVINLSVRATQQAAMTLYEDCGYQCWGVQPAYEQVGNQIVAGHFYSKNLRPMLVSAESAAVSET